MIFLSTADKRINEKTVYTGSTVLCGFVTPTPGAIPILRMYVWSIPSDQTEHKPGCCHYPDCVQLKKTWKSESNDKKVVFAR